MSPSKNHVDFSTSYYYFKQLFVECAPITLAFPFFEHVPTSGPLHSLIPQPGRATLTPFQACLLLSFSSQAVGFP